MNVPHLLWPPVLTDLLADGNRRRSAFTIAPLLTPRGPSQTKRSGAFPRPRRLLFFLLRPACLLSFRPFLPLRCHFLNFVSPNAERRMFFFFFQSFLPLQAKRLPNVSLLFTWRERKIGTHLSGFTECHCCLMNPWLQLQLCIPALQNRGIRNEI